MSQENQSSLRFSLEESVWFRKGQEVEELVSISLDPDITIQENDQYVSIRGALDLTGEYTSRPEEQTAEEGNLPNLKYVQSIEQRDENVCVFNHRFPVDISIPMNRIQSIYDIDVLVDSFDYSFPDRSCMELTADLMILGLYEPDPRAVEVKTTEIPEEVSNILRDTLQDSPAVEFQEKDEEIFVAEARKLPEDTGYENVLQPFAEFTGNQLPQNTYWNQHGLLERAETNGQTYQEVVEESPMEQVPESPALEPTEKQEELEVESSSSSEEEAPKKKKKSKKKSMSLTEFFARKDENEEQTKAKVKVCIIQKGDTLDNLSRRYDVSIQNILRVNHLEVNQDVHEGMVLYIPVSYAKK